LTVEFTVLGVACLGLNGGPAFKHNEAFSFQVATEDQGETDRYWNAIVGNGGQESECGWCKDKWGISWQITPIALTKAFTSPDRAAAKRAFDAMMTMRKIDIAAIEAAFRGRDVGGLTIRSSRSRFAARLNSSVMPTEPTMMVALAVNIGNLGPMSPARRPMADLVRALDAGFRARSGRVHVLDFFGHTGNFLVEVADRPGEVAQILGRLLGTACALVPIARVAQATAAAQAAPPPVKEAGQRWTPGVVFHVNGLASSAEPKDTHVARFQRLDDATILAWKRDVEDSRCRLDKRRRGGGWGAVSSAVGRQVGGLWTARSATTLDGVLMRIEETPCA